MLAEVLESHRASLAGLDRTARPPGPEARPEPPPATAAEPLPEGAPAAPPRPALRGAPPGTAAALLGATPEGLVAVLGPPALRRPEGAAEIWLYRGPHCALDLVLYRAAGPPRVAWAAARASGTETRTESACLRELSRAG